MVVVRQRRASVDATTTELPQEKLEPDEMPIEAAQRGLSEECGLTARNWRSCGEFWAVPAYSTHRVDVFVAERPERAKSGESRHEPIDVDRLPLREADRHGDDAISLAALQLSPPPQARPGSQLNRHRLVCVSPPCLRVDRGDGAEAVWVVCVEPPGQAGPARACCGCLHILAADVS